jgi:hypothetical protein
MTTLQSLFPTADELLAVPIEDLAPILLKLAAEKTQSAGFWPEAVTEITVGNGMAASRETGYDFYKKQKVEEHLGHTWNWLERNGFIGPSPGMNGRNGWKTLTPQGRAVADGQDFDRLSVPTTYGNRDVLVRGYVHEVVISCGAEVIARHPRSYEREDFVFDPLHYLALIEQKINALDEAAPLAGWRLPEEFATLRRLLRYATERNRCRLC